MWSTTRCYLCISDDDSTISCSAESVAADPFPLPPSFIKGEKGSCVYVT